MWHKNFARGNAALFSLHISDNEVNRSNFAYCRTHDATLSVYFFANWSRIVDSKPNFTYTYEY